MQHLKILLFVLLNLVCVVSFGQSLLADSNTDYSQINQGDNGFQYGYYTTQTTSGTFTTTNMIVVNNNWRISGSMPVVGKKYMHPSLNPAVRRYTIGLNDEPAYNGTVTVAGKFWDSQSGGGNGSKGFVTVDGIVKYSQLIPEGSSETSNFISYSFTVAVEEGSTIDFGITSEGNSSYDGRAMTATITANDPIPVQNLETNSNHLFTPQYNGNISGIKWSGESTLKIDGSPEDLQNLYTYHYDAVNRLKEANYASGTTSLEAWTTRNDQGGYSVDNISYDLNGNIQTLNRQTIDKDLKMMDALSYYYEGNRLMTVSDGADSLGFYDGNTTWDDYAYDANGNMIKDKNKSIDSIYYNHLNLPERVVHKDGRYVEYVYDAAGIKIRQITNDTSLHTRDYLGEYIYEDNQLQIIQHEEGRLTQQPSGEWVYEYHLKDHLGNVRTTFTTAPQDITFTVNFEQLGDDDMAYAQVDTTLIIASDIFDHTDATGTTYQKAQMLDGTDGKRVGAVLAVPVGKGDTINAHVWGKYVEITQSPSNAVATLASALIGAFTGTGSVTTTDGGISTINGNYGGGSLIGGSGFPLQNGSAPKAFLNLLFLPGEDSITLLNGTSFAYDQIDQSATQAIGQPKNQNFDQMIINDFIAPADGYVMVYVSNESDYITEVYFDDLSITINEHPVIQRDDYYPFGLTFNSYQRVTSKQNVFLYNGTEIERFLHFNLYGMEFRQYDPALGRFTSNDPIVHFDYSTYSAFDNNPIFYADPSGADSESFIDEIFNSSEEGVNTTWTNNNDGTFSDGNGIVQDCVECKRLNEEKRRLEIKIKELKEASKSKAKWARTTRDLTVNGAIANILFKYITAIGEMSNERIEYYLNNPHEVESNVLLYIVQYEIDLALGDRIISPDVKNMTQEEIATEMASKIKDLGTNALLLIQLTNTYVNAAVQTMHAAAVANQMLNHTELLKTQQELSKVQKELKILSSN